MKYDNNCLDKISFVSNRIYALKLFVKATHLYINLGGLNIDVYIFIFINPNNLHYTTYIYSIYVQYIMYYFDYNYNICIMIFSVFYLTCEGEKLWSQILQIIVWTNSWEKNPSHATYLNGKFIENLFSENFI